MAMTPMEYQEATANDTELTLASGISGHVYVNRHEDIVTLNIQVSGGLTVNTYTTVLASDLPDKYKPKDKSVLAFVGTFAGYGLASIYDSVQIRCSATAAYGLISYIGK